MLVTSAKTVPVAAFWIRVTDGRVQSLALVEGTWRVVCDEPLAEPVNTIRKAATVRDCPTDMPPGHDQGKVRLALLSLR
jgi:hypothetical protein